MTNEFKNHIRRQLDIFRHEIRYAEEHAMPTEARIFRAQAAAYRMGLEEVLNAERVAEIFESYDFGGHEA
ncbi:MAG: hypothetical protein U0K60_04195 [Parafannyhessea umbonata]|nr:hypothetical protein [Parafannyhessea umbonata]